MADNTEIAWLAGLLEGEGCFATRGTGHNPIIQLIMIDKDVVIKAAKIMGSHKVVKNKIDSRGGKQLFRTVLYGANAIEIMQKVYPFMGERRQAKIQECVCVFNTKRAHVKKYKQRTPYSRGAEIVWIKEEPYAA